MSAVFAEPNLVSAAGVVPSVALAEPAELRELADAHLTVPADKGANAGLNALIATVSTEQAPVIVAQRLRKGSGRWIRA